MICTLISLAIRVHKDKMLDRFISDSPEDTHTELTCLQFIHNGNKQQTGIEPEYKDKRRIYNVQVNLSVTCPKDII